MPGLLLGLICIVLAIYFCGLQTKYYQHYQPFFDSLSYFNEIHVVMITGQNEGLSAAIEAAVSTQSTVFMPRLIAALVSPWIPPARTLGVWIQMGQIFLLMASLMYYYQRALRVDRWRSLVLALPVAMLGFLYERHGGVSDFRMDLSLAVFYAMACVWYLIAVATLQWQHFLTLGLVASLGCLFRATAPVYLLIALGPVAILQLYFSSQQRSLVQGFTVAAVTVVAGSLWFFIANFNTLHYYYFVWNTDANANLPFSQSWKHIKFAVRHVGGGFWYWILLMNGVILWMHSRRVNRQDFQDSEKGSRDCEVKSQNGRWNNVSNYLKNSLIRTDLRLLWFGVAPLAMLVLRGAGLNPYVCLPAVLGFYLVLMDPLAKDDIWFVQPTGKITTMALFAVLVWVMIAGGQRHHKKSNHRSMAAHKAIIDSIVTDARNHGIESVAFDSSHVFFTHTRSLESAIRFDIPDAKFSGHQMHVEGIKMQPRGVFSSCVAVSDWEAMKGTSKEKLDQLIDQANDQLDYLLTPVGESVSYMQNQVPQNIINRHQEYIRQRLLSKDSPWVAVGGPVTNRSEETVQLYRNGRRIELAQQRLISSGEDRFNHRPKHALGPTLKIVR
jgi:hypothetical protein